MSNPLRGEVEFKAGDENYQLVFDPNAFCHIEQAMGGTTTDDMIDMLREGRVGFLLVRAVIFGGLQAKHPCTLQRAGELLGLAGIKEGRRAAFAGFQAAFAASTGAEEEPEPGEAGTAGGSGTG